MFFKSTRRFFLFLMEEAAVFLWYGLLGRLSSSHRIYVFSLMSMWLPRKHSASCVFFSPLFLPTF
ncbi:hypothetical protein DW710_08350, partial [Bacteroides sp. AM27-13]